MILIISQPEEFKQLKKQFGSFLQHRDLRFLRKTALVLLQLPKAEKLGKNQAKLKYKVNLENRNFQRSFAHGKSMDRAERLQMLMPYLDSQAPRYAKVAIVCAENNGG